MRRVERETPDTRKGLAAPVSLLLIVFSLTLVSTVAYNYALRQIDNRKEDLKLVAAEEKMLDLEEAITSTAWTPSGSRTLAFSDYGGRLRGAAQGRDGGQPPPGQCHPGGVEWHGL
jgi:hypothetical protein